MNAVSNLVKLFPLVELFTSSTYFYDTMFGFIAPLFHFLLPKSSSFWHTLGPYLTGIEYQLH